MKTVQIIAFIASLTLLVCILELIRRRKLKERFALLWLFSSIILIVFSVWIDLLEILARIIGIHYAPAVFIPVIIFFMVVLFIYFSVIVSEQSEHIKILAQKLAILESTLGGRGISNT
ncbi:MAG: DUF2304 domain-containing protein [candidate division WOR-3 bacterium]|nr:MAG: DUF2304 domain-containing protein [candidate division WOR-3 bacterium]